MWLSFIKQNNTHNILNTCIDDCHWRKMDNINSNYLQMNNKWSMKSITTYDKNLRDTPCIAKASLISYLVVCTSNDFQ